MMRDDAVRAKSGGSSGSDMGACRARQHAPAQTGSAAATQRHPWRVHCVCDSCVQWRHAHVHSVARVDEHVQQRAHGVAYAVHGQRPNLNLQDNKSAACEQQLQ